MSLKTEGLFYRRAKEPSPVVVSNITLKQLCRRGAYTEVRAAGYLKFHDTDKLCKKMEK